MRVLSFTTDSTIPPSKQAKPALATIYGDFYALTDGRHPLRYGVARGVNPNEFILVSPSGKPKAQTLRMTGEWVENRHGSLVRSREVSGYTLAVVAHGRIAPLVTGKPKLLRQHKASTAIPTSL
jgi:hypothetical protein